MLSKKKKGKNLNHRCSKNLMLKVIAFIAYVVAPQTTLSRLILRYHTLYYFITPFTTLYYVIIPYTTLSDPILAYHTSRHTTLSDPILRYNAL